MILHFDYWERLYIYLPLRQFHALCQEEVGATLLPPFSFARISNFYCLAVMHSATWWHCFDAISRLESIYFGLMGAEYNFAMAIYLSFPSFVFPREPLAKVSLLRQMQCKIPSSNATFECYENLLKKDIYAHDDRRDIDYIIMYQCTLVTFI